LAELHPHELPAVVRINADASSDRFADWIQLEIADRWSLAIRVGPVPPAIFSSTGACIGTAPGARIESAAWTWEAGASGSGVADAYCICLSRESLYETASKSKGGQTRDDLMNLLRVVGVRGIPGVATGLAAGEAFPAEETKKSGGLAALQNRRAPN